MTEPPGAAGAAGQPRPKGPHRRGHHGRRIRERLAVRLYRGARTVLGRLPGGPTFRVAGWLAVASYWAWPEKRRIVRANCAIVLGCAEDDPRVGRLARQIFRNQTRWVLELMRLSRTLHNRTLFEFSAHAADEFERRWRDNGGVVIVGLHLGNNEAAAAALAHRGIPVTVVADDTAYGELYDELAADRRSWGVELVGWRNLRGVFRVLRAGEILGLLVDWGYREEDVPVRFLGEWTTFPGGPAVLAAKTGASIVPFWVIRQPDGTFDGRVFEAIRVRSSDPADIQDATQAIADAVTDGIRRAPEQWCVFKPMWPADPAVRQRLAAIAASGKLHSNGAAPGGPGASSGLSDAAAAGSRIAALSAAATDDPAGETSLAPADS